MAGENRINTCIGILSRRRATIILPTVLRSSRRLVEPSAYRSVNVSLRPIASAQRRARLHDRGATIRAMASTSASAAATDAAAVKATQSLRQLSLEHDPATPDVASEDDTPVASGSTSPPQSASVSAPQDGTVEDNATSRAPFERTDDGIVFGASTRLGGRILHEGRDPWTHNAWDNVEWDEEQEEAAQKAIEKQKLAPIPPEEQERLNATPARYWDLFYKNVEDRFFKDRAWLCQEFEALKEAIQPNAGPKRMCEIGCGTGATAYPLLASNENPDLFIHCLDYSPRAVGLVERNPAYDPAKIAAEVWSLSDPNGLSPKVKPGSIDVATLIFCLSALHPDEWQQAVKNIWTMLKPGGILCLRDYGRNDLTQLRFKSARLMEPNLYARGDKTRVYFFTKEELQNLFSPTANPSSTEGRTEEEAHAEHYPFETMRLGVDRRLLMNRKRKLKMYRVWMQGIFRKPLDATDVADSH